MEKSKACSFDAIENNNGNAKKILGCKIAEYFQAVFDGRPCFHISLIMDVSPNCDCHGENDAPVLSNIGMLASFDPVALDMVCADLCQKATPFSNFWLDEHLAAPHFHHHQTSFLTPTPM